MKTLDEFVQNKNVERNDSTNQRRKKFDPYNQWDYAPKDWNTYSLWDIANYLNGRAFKRSEVRKFGLPIIKIKELKYGFGSYTEYFDEDISEIDEKYLLSKNDILFSWSGNPTTSLDTFLYENDFGILIHPIFKIDPNEQIIDYYYCFLLLKYMRTTFIELARDQATSMGHVKISDLKKITVELPSKIEQNPIKQILLTLEEKIALNTQLNHTLESLAQFLFHSWFVRFDPFQDGEFVDSELGPIPKGWKIVPLRKLIKLDKGLSYKGKFLSDEGVPLINLGNIGLNGFRNEKLKHYSGDYRPRHCVQKGNIVVANTDMTYNREILGRPIIIPNYIDSEEFIFTHHIYAIRNQSDIPNLFFYFVFHKSDYKFRVENYATGTTVLAIPRDSILDYQIPLPDLKTIQDFMDLVNPLFKLIDKNEKESLFLSSLRDLLLPKLLSGKLRIKNPEQFLEELENASN
ncbi:MAG: restriction endonuclease subunit S [Candidatus Heimdallarchaeaceae archaeon]